MHTFKSYVKQIMITSVRPFGSSFSVTSLCSFLTIICWHSRFPTVRSLSGLVKNRDRSVVDGAEVAVFHYATKRWNDALFSYSYWNLLFVYSLSKIVKYVRMCVCMLIIYLRLVVCLYVQTKLHCNASGHASYTSQHAIIRITEIKNIYRYPYRWYMPRQPVTTSKTP